MSDFKSRLPARPSLEQLQKQAKELLRQYRDGDNAAAERFHAASPGAGEALADAQFVIAREYGFESWAKLKHHIEALRLPNPEQYEKLAKDVLAACQGDSEALRRLIDVFGAAPTRSGNPLDAEQLRAHVIERLTAIPGAESRTGELTLADTQLFIARQYGLENWAKLVGATGKSTAAPPPFYKINRKENTIQLGLLLSDKDWDVVFGVIKEQGITGLDAGGRMTDAALERISKLDQLTRLNLGGSLQLTDSGLAQLTRMPQLQELDISGWKGQITDRGLDVLRHLPALTRFQMCWQQNVSDAGAANLGSCDQLESVNLLGTPTGDGVIEALAGKAKLGRLRTGRGVTDAGLALFHGFPVFKTWHGGEVRYNLMSPDAEPNHLLVDGPFTNAGLENLAGLDGLFGLSFFWHCTGFTSDGLKPLKDLPNLGFLGCEGERCDDEAMRHIAAIPRLRMLMAQGTVASDAGFAALSRSQTIEYIWGRECPNLTGPGFAALLAMPVLRGLAASCKNVDDAALSALPRFPALRQLMPMDVSDEGFLHVGRCERLEGLWCMYCRETGDTATGHIAGLSRLETYYAGKTRITDRSLEILGGMTSLERLEFWQCAGLTDAGVAHLTSLPRLREISLDGLAGVTREAAGLFPARVRVNYST